MLGARRGYYWSCLGRSEQPLRAKRGGARHLVKLAVFTVFYVFFCEVWGPPGVPKSLRDASGRLPEPLGAPKSGRRGLQRPRSERFRAFSSGEASKKAAAMERNSRDLSQATSKSRLKCLLLISTSLSPFIRRRTNQ